MPPTRTRLKDRLVVAALVAGGVLMATPGVHLFERWLPHTRAVLASHALALLVLLVAVQQWRARRHRDTARCGHAG